MTNKDELIGSTTEAFNWNQVNFFIAFIPLSAAEKVIIYVDRRRNEVQFSFFLQVWIKPPDTVVGLQLYCNLSIWGMPSPKLKSESRCVPTDYSMKNDKTRFFRFFYWNIHRHRHHFSTTISGNVFIPRIVYKTLSKPFDLQKKQNRRFEIVFMPYFVTDRMERAK